MEHGLPGLGRAPEKGLSIIPAPIYPDQAAHALAIFKQLRIVDAPGSPTFRGVLCTVVFDLVTGLSGSCDSQTGVRHLSGNIHSDTQKKRRIPHWPPGS